MRTVYDQMRGGTVPMMDVKERALIERIVAKDALKFGFVVWMALRLALSAWGSFIMLIAPPDTYAHVLKADPSVVLPGHDLHGFTLGLWNIYDTQHYIRIAENGYTGDIGFLTAFFPGFPLMIKLASPLFLGDSLLAGMVIANVSALVFFWFLYRLVEADYGENVARRAVVFSAIFPTSFFLFVPYTEAPLLAFTVASLYYGRQHKWWLAGLLACAAALIKQPGIFLVLPLGYMYWRQQGAYGKGAFARKRFRRLDWLWLLLCPAAGLGYMLYKYISLAVQTNGVMDLGAGEEFVLPGVPLVKALLAIRPDNPFLAADLMEVGFAVMMIALVAATVLTTRSRTYSAYAVALTFVSLGVTWGNYYRPEVDIPRRLLIIFPIFIYLALITSKPRVFRIVCYISVALLLSLSALFVNWVFIS